jgi:hypothetical protein
LTTYRLGSSAAIYAPGIVNWAIHGYWNRPDRPHLENTIANGWNIPVEAVRALLSKKAPYTIDGETVVFTA